jgi:DNA-binding NarL/FixJ family response regulator
LSRPYDAALALLSSDDEQHLRDAFTRLDALGAAPAARKTRQRLRQLGFAVPNGARATTKEHPLGLTRREQEVLDALATGASNDEIAAQLVITSKTVDHHVSSILAKLGVANRHLAAREARRLGLVQDGEPAATT